MSFKVIETQEQLDAIIGERVARAKDAVRKEFDGWVSPDELNNKTNALTDKVTTLEGALNDANKKIEEHDNLIAEKDKTIKAHELRSVKTRIAHENGLSYDAINFLQGDNEDAIKESAKTLKSLVGANNVPPMANPEPIQGSAEDTALLELARALGKE